MARALRIERAGGRYHVTARGNERKAIYRRDRDRGHFLELLGQLPERFGARVHAYVLMENHFHLLLETPEANLSTTMQWLNVSYSVWFNRAHERAGHLFQGRFKAVVVEDDAGWQELGRYVHLNPVRLAALGLNKRQRTAGRAGVGPAPTPELVAKRLEVLRQWRWSSYRGYAGYCVPAEWLTREPLARLCGGRTETERRAALRDYTEAPLRQGVIEAPWQRLIGGFVLGSEAFARRLRGQVTGNRREQLAARRLTHRASWEELVEAVEKLKGQSWEEFRDHYGDWGRDATLWLGRRVARLSLPELARLAGGAEYNAVAQALTRFGKRLEREPELRQELTRVQNAL
jgi:REP element-mobilizing transposase RayT